MAPKRKQADQPAEKPAKKKTATSKNAPVASDNTTSMGTSTSKGSSSSKKTTTASKKATTKSTKATTSKASGSTSASTSSSKSKSKKVEQPIVIDDSETGSEQASVDPSTPPPVAKGKGKSKAKDPSSSPDKEKMSGKRTSSAAKKQPKVLSFEDACRAWFRSYADDDNENRMGGEGVERLFEDLGVSMEGVTPFVMAYKANAANFGSFTWDEWLTLCKAHKIQEASTLKAELEDAEEDLYPAIADGDPTADYQFKFFYSFLFNYLKEEGQKSLVGGMASAVWGIVLAPKYPLAAKFVEFTQEPGTSFKGVSSDTWAQLLEFCQTVKEDLSGYSEDEAWPAILDEFVEWRREKIAKGE